MWEPASAVERWGNSTVAYVGGVEYFVAMVASLVVGYCFYRDFHDGSIMTRGYFLTLVWKRIFMAAICGSHVMMFASPRLGLVVQMVAAAGYIIASGWFIFVWASKGRAIRNDEYVGHALRHHGLEIDTMTQPEATAMAKKFCEIALDKTQASLSNIHHHA